LIANPLGIFGLDLSPRGMFLCCNFPLHGVEDDARMLGMQGEVLKIKDEASMEVLVLHCFRKRRGDGRKVEGRFLGCIRLGFRLFYY
jgi:hypothetical protein